MRLVIAGITPDPRTYSILHLAEKNGVGAIDISVDDQLPEYLNVPHDLHPNAAANGIYVDKLEAYLKSNILTANRDVR